MSAPPASDLGREAGKELRGGAEDEYVLWELVWAKSKKQDDWWPCQICEVPDSRYQVDLTDHIKLENGEYCVYCFGSLNYTKIKPGTLPSFTKS
jgi:hypothetical protein